MNVGTEGKTLTRVQSFPHLLPFPPSPPFPHLLLFPYPREAAVLRSLVSDFSFSEGFNEYCLLSIVTALNCHARGSL